MEATTKAHSSHIGRKISRIRELRNIKQEAMAAELGITQQAVSKLEQSESLEEETLERVAKVLGVSPEAIKNYSDEAVIYNIQNNYDNAAHNINYSFNPIEKIVALYDEKVALLERLLESEREKVELLKGNGRKASE